MKEALRKVGEKEILRYLYLVDRRLTIVTSGINWKPEYDDEMKGIDMELANLRELVDAEHTKREQSKDKDAGNRTSI